MKADMDETPAATHATTDRRNRTARRWAFGLLAPSPLRGQATLRG